MKVAEILSDLTSLRVCDRDAAMALVSSDEVIRGNAEEGRAKDQSKKESAAASSPQSSNSMGKPDAADPDLRRALDLVELHYGVKQKHARGLDVNLKKAREDVEDALASARRR